MEILEQRDDSDLSHFFFFFQAEDGIRDLIVTGVQTCALPISDPALGERQRRVRVLVIDADFRKPGIAAAMGMSNEKGLSNILRGEQSVDEVLLQANTLPNLWVLPAGPIPGNPTDLLSSPDMARLVEELRQRFEHIVLDSPPILLMTDA